MNADLQILHFKIRRRGFSLPLAGIVEIIYYKPPVEVPQLQEPFKGVIDLRDKVIPVIDLRQLLEINTEKNDPPEHILIIQFKKTLMGLIVDKVKDVLYLSEDQLQSATFQNQEQNKYLKGIFKHQDELIMLLDLDKILDLEAYQMLNQLV
ncbi:MAG: chemotaxis protein CheW [Nitrospiria bacterium]